MMAALHAGTAWHPNPTWWQARQQQPGAIQDGGAGGHSRGVRLSGQLPRRALRPGIQQVPQEHVYRDVLGVRAALRRLLACGQCMQSPACCRHAMHAIALLTGAQARLQSGGMLDNDLSVLSRAWARETKHKGRIAAEEGEWSSHYGGRSVRRTLASRASSSSPRAPLQALREQRGRRLVLHGARRVAAAARKQRRRRSIPARRRCSPALCSSSSRPRCVWGILVRGRRLLQQAPERLNHLYSSAKNLLPSTVSYEHRVCTSLLPLCMPAHAGQPLSWVIVSSGARPAPMSW